MAYLNCPECGLSVALLFPVAPIEHCPRCLGRRRKAVELFVSSTPRRQPEASPGHEAPEATAAAAG